MNLEIFFNKKVSETTALLIIGVSAIFLIIALIENFDAKAISSHPVTLIMLSGFFINFLKRHWTALDNIRHEKLTFINETGDALHRFYPILFQEINQCDFDLTKDSALNKERINLFQNRYMVMLKSKLYVTDKNFWKKYNAYILELDRIVQLIMDESYYRKNSQRIKEAKSIKQTNKLNACIGQIDSFLEDYSLHNKDYIKKNDSFVENKYHIVKERLSSETELNDTDIKNLMYCRASFVWLRTAELLEDALEKDIIES